MGALALASFTDHGAKCSWYMRLTRASTHMKVTQPICITARGRHMNWPIQVLGVVMKHANPVAA